MISLLSQAAAIATDSGAEGYIRWGVTILLAAAGGVIGLLWRLDRAQLVNTITKQDAEAAKLSDRLDYSAKKMEVMAAEYVAARTELAREQARREAREEHVRDVGSSPGRLPTNPAMQAIPLPLPPPRTRHHDE